MYRYVSRGFDLLGVCPMEGSYGYSLFMLDIVPGRFLRVNVIFVSLW